MFDRLNRYVDVEVGPEQVVGAGQLHVGQLRDRRLAEPGKVSEWKEELPLLEQQPEAMPRNIRDFNR